MTDKEQLIKFFDDYKDIAEEFMGSWVNLSPSDEKELNLIGYSYALIDRYGGEDCGRDFWAVWKFTHKDTGEEVLLKFEGWYASHYGAEFERFFEVQPKQKTITVFE